MEVRLFHVGKMEMLKYGTSIGKIDSTEVIVSKTLCLKRYVFKPSDENIYSLKEQIPLFIPFDLCFMEM